MTWMRWYMGRFQSVILLILVLGTATLPMRVSRGAGVARYQFSNQWPIPKPYNVATDGAGNIYVTQSDTFKWQKLSPSGIVLLDKGGFGEGQGQFTDADGIAVDGSGNIYVSDETDDVVDRVQKFSPTGDYIKQWGYSGNGQGGFDGPESLAIDGSGNVYVADEDNNRIQVFTSEGVFVKILGGPGVTDGRFNGPYGVAVDAQGNVYVADTDNHRIQKFDSTGAFAAKWGGVGSADGQFVSPYAVAVDNAGNIYVADTGNNRVQIFAPDRTLITSLVDTGSPNDRFNGPKGVAVDGSGNVYVADTGNSRILKFISNIGTLKITVKDTSNNILSEANVESISTPSGQPGFSGSTDNSGLIVKYGLLSGDYSLKASKASFLANSVASVRVDAGSTKEIVIVLSAAPPTTGNIRVLVVDSNNKPLPGVTVTSTHVPSGETPITGTTDDNGVVMGNGLASGSYTMQATKTGFITASGSGDIIPAQTTEIRIMLRPVAVPPGSINVKVIRLDGDPIVGANLALSSQSPSSMTQTTGSDGSATFGGVAPGTYTVTASRIGYADKTSDPLTLSSGATLQVTLTLEGSGEAILDHFEFNYINGPETVGVPFTITIIAKDQRGDVLASYNGVNTLDTLPGPDPLIQTPVVTPSSTTPFTQGRWVGGINLSSAGQSVTLRTNGGGKSGLSNSFEVMRSGYEPPEPGGWTLPSYPVESIIIGFIVSLFLIMVLSKNYLRTCELHSETRRNFTHARIPK